MVQTVRKLLIQKGQVGACQKQSLELFVHYFFTFVTLSGKNADSKIVFMSFITFCTYFHH